MTAIKLCGLSTRDTVGAALALGVDYIGLVFFPPSPRAVSPDFALALAGDVGGRVRRVGVFVDPDDALIDAALPVIDVIQLHGGEQPGRAAALRERTGRPVWKGLPVATRADVAAAALAWAGAADRLLFDAKAPAGAELPGGNGVALDWRVIDPATLRTPWGLAGGLDAGNVARAIAETGAPLVDASSGLEDAAGMKSVAKMTAFVAAARGR